MVLLVCLSQELSRISLDNDTSEILSRPPAVFQAHGLVVDHAIIIHHRDAGNVDFETTWQNTQESARHN
ncbi:hypothetical protein HD806DRAFT_116928 [Xylariaceae sp. AK1471]|nr:hypothetical protein HD806DRAFT_116928 [Xylariaceae sp. AK1471]